MDPTGQQPTAFQFSLDDLKPTLGDDEEFNLACLVCRTLDAASTVRHAIPALRHTPSLHAQMHHRQFLATKMSAWLVAA